MNFLEISPYVFGTRLTWYSVFVLLGALACYAISEFFYHKDPESKKYPDLILTTFLIAFPSGLVGARIWYVLSELEMYLSDPISILKVWEGGLAIQGGVLLGAAVGIIYANIQLKAHGMRLKITTLMDMVIPNILLSQAIGRWGNFFNREVYGACVNQETLWFLPSFIRDYMRGGFVSGEYIACHVDEYAQPLFLYEGLLNFLGFVLITIVLRKILYKYFKNRFSGVLSASYLIWYGIVRVSLEGLRNETFIMMWGKVRQSVATSILYIVLGVAFLTWIVIKGIKNKEILSEITEVTNSENIVNEVEKNNEVIIEKETVKKVPSKTRSSTSKKTTSVAKKTAKKEDK